MCMSGRLSTVYLCSCASLTVAPEFIPPPRHNVSCETMHMHVLTRLYFHRSCRKSHPPSSPGTSLSKTRSRSRGSCRAVVYNFNQRVNSVSAVTRNRQSLVPPQTDWIPPSCSIALLFSHHLPSIAKPPANPAARGCCLTLFRPVK